MQAGGPNDHEFLSHFFWLEASVRMSTPSQVFSKVFPSSRPCNVVLALRPTSAAPHRRYRVVQLNNIHAAKQARRRLWIESQLIHLTLIVFSE